MTAASLPVPQDRNATIKGLAVSAGRNDLQDQTHHDRFGSSMLMRLLQRTEAGYSPMNVSANYNRKPFAEEFFWNQSFTVEQDAQALP